LPATVFSALLLPATVFGALVIDPTAAYAAGLPQLDPKTFSPQLIWLAITFLVLYLLMWRVALPRISQVLEERQRRIEDNLNRADQFRIDAQAASQAYDVAMAEARDKARNAVRQMRDRMRHEAETRLAEQTGRLQAEIRAAESAIGKAKSEAEGEVRLMAAELAREVVSRLTGEAVEAEEAQTAVNGLPKGRG